MSTWRSPKLGLRAVLAALIILATVGFVVGTSIERGETSHESAAALKAEGGTETHGEGAESEATHAGDSGEHAGRTTTVEEHHAELRPLGIDIEAVPFVVLAAVGSLALVIAAWLRPGWVALLLCVIAAMVVFAVLDVREVSHQSDESRTGLAVLAAVIAALHVAAAVVAAVMAWRARRVLGGPSAPAGTMAA